jgi:hypothetical protein
MQLLSHQHGSYLRGAVPQFLHDFQLVCLRWAQMKVDWIVLIAPVRKSGCGAHTVSHV